MLYVFDQCKQFKRTIPNLIMDDKTLEDIDSDGEDHVYDETCNLCMARPLAPEISEKVKSDVEKRLKQLEEGSEDQYERYEKETVNDFAMSGF